MKKHLRALCQKTKKVEIRKKGKIVLSESQVITGNLCPRHSIDCKASWLLSSSLLKATPPWLLSMEGEGYLCHHIVLMSQCFHPHARSVIFIPLTCLLPENLLNTVLRVRRGLLLHTCTPPTPATCFFTALKPTFTTSPFFHTHTQTNFTYRCISIILSPHNVATHSKAPDTFHTSLLEKIIKIES